MKTSQRLSLSSLLVFTAVSSAEAHPVFFSDGWGLSLWNSAAKTEAYAAYTLSHRLALGARYFGFRDGSGSKFPTEQHQLAQTSLLLKRWNETASQANIYLQLGAGRASFEGKDSRFTRMAELEADWEDRRLYTVAKLKYLQASGHDEKAGAMFRFGVAPYLADFTELNTWIIFELEKDFRGRDSLGLTPLVRLFYNNVLTEFGYNLAGDFRFNFMTHF